MATTRPGVQKPHCTAPASTNASCTRCSSPFSASPSTVTTSWPSACAASTRHAQTSVPSSSTEHDPHSPCSQAFFDPGRPSLSRSAKRRLSPAQTSASRCSPLTVSSIFTPAPVERALRQHAQRVPPVRGGAAHVVDRAGRLGDAVGERRRRRRAVRGRASAPARRSRTPREALRRPRTASETTAITIAFRGPTFMNVCLPPVSTQQPDDELVLGEDVLLRSDEEVRQRDDARAADARELDLRAGRRAAAAARRRPATTCRGSRRSCRGSGSAASRRCATPPRARAGGRRAAPPSPPRR